MDDAIPVNGILYKEGAPSVDGRIINADAISFAMPLPITRGIGGEIIGKAMQVSREGGVISFEGYVYNIDEIAPGWRPALTLSHVSVSERAGFMHVESGRAREVRLTPDAAFNEAQIRIDGRSN